ncbi:hypothetical protein R5R35_009894 [Gryllus longicercus]|uniref:UDP-glucuronosyltransferase n=1 Tax=Gryllus longicercus TaxID=2509291 RepID=A0AAN9WAD3_9ORTH
MTRAWAWLVALALAGWASPGGLPPAAEGARILGVFGHIGKSHWDVFEPLMQELARRGHQVTVVSHFPQAAPRANYTDVSLKGSLTDFSPVGQIDVTEMKVDNMWDVYNEHLLLSQLAVTGCEVAFAHPDVQRLLRSNETFDLLITELFTTDCYVAFAHHYNIPSIGLSSCMMMPWAYERFGNPQNPAYIPDLFHAHGMQMSFWERWQNSWKILLDNLAYEYLYHRPSEQVVRRYFKDLPPLKEIARNVSMMFVNTHVSLSHARPYVPAVLEVGGIHLPQRKPLPKDVKEFLDGAGEEGVVYFNMGSMIRATSMAPEKRRAFLEAFGRMGQRVLWKWEEADMPGQTPNVKTSRWLPQFDILNHPKVKVYIGHGGLLGSTEAAHAGVPMVAIPIFGDQRANVQNLLQAGMALKLDYHDVTADSVLAALKEVLQNPKYREGARRVSEAFRDRPVGPLDAAVFWTEYVLRHNGAPFLRNAVAADLAWYQRWLLDVVAASAAAFVLAVLALRALAARLLPHGPIAHKLKGE